MSMMNKPHIPRVRRGEVGLSKLFIALLADATKRDKETAKKLFNL